MGLKTSVKVIKTVSSNSELQPYFMITSRSFLIVASISLSVNWEMIKFPLLDNYKLVRLI